MKNVHWVLCLGLLLINCFSLYAQSAPKPQSLSQKEWDLCQKLSGDPLKFLHKALQHDDFTGAKRINTILCEKQNQTLVPALCFEGESILAFYKAFRDSTYIEEFLESIENTEEDEQYVDRLIFCSILGKKYHKSDLPKELIRSYHDNRRGDGKIRFNNSMLFNLDCNKELEKYDLTKYIKYDEVCVYLFNSTAQISHEERIGLVRYASECETRLLAAKYIYDLTVEQGYRSFLEGTRTDDAPIKIINGIYEDGCQQAGYYVAMAYEISRQGSYNQVIVPLNNAAIADYPPAMRELGKCYEEGRYGLTKNLLDYEKWVRRAAAKGDAEAIGITGYMALFASTEGPGNHDSVRVRCQKAIALGNFGISPWTLGVLNAMDGNGVEAIKLYNDVLKNHNSSKSNVSSFLHGPNIYGDENSRLIKWRFLSLRNLASIYENGKPDVEKNYPKALEYYDMALDLIKERDIMFKRALLLKRMDRPCSEFVSELEKVENKESYNYLASMYKVGECVIKDKRKAKEYERLAGSTVE